MTTMSATTTTTTTDRDVISDVISEHLEEIEQETHRVRMMIKNVENWSDPYLEPQLKRLLDKLRRFPGTPDPWQTLSELSKCDFRYSGDVLELCDILGMTGWPPIQFSIYPRLFIDIGPESIDSNQIVPIATSSVDDDRTASWNDAHPCFLGLSLVEPGVQSPATHPDRPKFILPLGNLLEYTGNNKEGMEARRRDDNTLFRETGYLVVIDALSDSKALWIVFNNSQMNDLGDRVYVTHADLPKPFPGITEDFTIAQIAPSLEDWLRNRSDMGGISVPKNIKDTMGFGTPKLSMVTEMDVATAFSLRKST